MSDVVQAPADRQSERSIISALAAEPRLFRYASHLTPDHFWDREAREAFVEMKAMHTEGRAWLVDDDPKVAEWLFAGRLGVLEFELEELVRKVEEAYTCRVGFHSAKEIAKAAIAQDAAEVERLASGITLPTRGDLGRPASEIATDVYDLIGEDEDEVVETGFTYLDRAEALRRRESLGLAARPSMGKSQLAFQIAANVAEKGVACVWSGEMDELSVIDRIAGSRAGMSRRDIRDADGVNKYSVALAGVTRLERLMVFDKPMTSMDLWSQCRRVADRFGGLDLVVVDHIRLMKDTGDVERHRLGRIVANLREIGKELNCAVVQCIQLNRGPEGREDKRPDLGDLRDSGEIEENLDVASFIYREGYYTARQKGGSQSGKAEVYARKNRNGRLWAAFLYFDADRGPRFAQMQAQPF